MKIKIDIGMLILMLFTYILLAVILLEIVYFENKLTEVITLLNNISGSLIQ